MRSPSGPASGSESGGWRRRVGWLILIWGASVLALMVVAALVRVLMSTVGLTR
jgi:hypothetical protein